MYNVYYRERGGKDRGRVRLYHTYFSSRAMVMYVESDLFWHSLCLVSESSSVAVPPSLSTCLLTKLKLL